MHRATQYLPMVKALSKDHWDAIFKEISNILAASDNKPKRKHPQSASSHGSEAAEEEEAAPEYILVSDDE